MSTAAAVRVTAFGEGRRELALPGRQATVDDVLSAAGFEAKGRRVAVNGHAADARTTVREGDEVTVVPRVQGG
jgi:sulfur carrier protein ThiS